MPVIVIGADTEAGRAIVPALQPSSGEIRLFVTDEAVGEDYRLLHKVAVGDVSDGSHVGGAAIGTFCAVVVASAAHDDRERHFAPTPGAVFAQWADGLKDAAVGRIIVVGRPDEIPNPDPLAATGAQYIMVETTGRDLTDMAAQVAAAEATRNP